MEIKDQLFESNRIRLDGIDHENDAAIEAKWTADPEYLSLVSLQPVRPLSPAQVKKKYEQIEKKAKEGERLFYFAVRLKPSGEETSERLLGFAKIEWVDWTNSNAWISLGIGEVANRRQGYGTEILQMLIHYAFSELNLFYLGAFIPEYNLAALVLFKKFGFVEEVRRRGAINRAGRRWDLLQMGLLITEWKEGAI